MATNTNDPAKNLSTLALFIATDVRHAIMASYVTHLAGAWFNKFPEEEQRMLFRSHPANNLVYSGLSALVEQSIVRISETLKDENDLHPHDADLRRKRDLGMHRHAISHPATVKWREARMQAFADSGRDHYDFRPGQVWDLQRSINEELKKHGLPVHNDSIPVTRDMAESLHLILDLSRRPECPIPSVEELLECLRVRAPKFQAVLEKNADGGRDPQREREHAERRRLRKERWAEAAKKRQEDASKPPQEP